MSALGFISGIFGSLNNFKFKQLEIKCFFFLEINVSSQIEMVRKVAMRLQPVRRS